MLLWEGRGGEGRGGEGREGEVNLLSDLSEWLDPLLS